MPEHPHPDPAGVIVICAVITVSDTRTPDTDRSGQLIQQLLKDSGHQVSSYAVLKDELPIIKAQLIELGQCANLQVLILNGGTGIAPRDTTYEVVECMLDKPLPGFGELFRWLSYQEIGSRAMASRAIAGTYGDKLIFSLPGSTSAVKLGMEHLILPEIVHLTTQMKQS
jgi:molybdopterin adenylyltransferase